MCSCSIIISNHIINHINIEPHHIISYHIVSYPHTLLYITYRPDHIISYHIISYHYHIRIHDYDYSYFSQTKSCTLGCVGLNDTFSLFLFLHSRSCIWFLQESDLHCWLPPGRICHQQTPRGLLWGDWLLAGSYEDTHFAGAIASTCRWWSWFASRTSPERGFPKGCGEEGRNSWHKGLMVSD